MHSGKSIIDGERNTVIASVDEFKIYLNKKYGKPKHMKNQVRRCQAWTARFSAGVWCCALGCGTSPTCTHNCRLAFVCLPQEAAMGRTGIVCFENITGKGKEKGTSHLDLWDGKTTATIDDHWTDCEVSSGRRW